MTTVRQAGTETGTADDFNGAAVSGGHRGEAIMVGVEGGEYGPLDIRMAASESLREKLQLDPSLATRIDPGAWLKLVREAVPLSDLAVREATPQIMADAIIPQITIRCRLASQLGRSHAVIMSVHPRDVQPEYREVVTGMLTPEVLEGASKIVFDHMVLSSLGYGAAHQPTLDFWQSEAGDWQGFNIVAHFPPSTKVAQATLEDLASTAIGQIPTKALLESISGRTFTSVLSFREGDDNFIEKDSSRYPDDLPVDLKEDLYRPGNVKPHMLKGPAAEVWKFCKENGLEPTLEYWETSSDEGTFSGYEIVIHWFQEAAATADEKLYRDGMLPTTT